MHRPTRKISSGPWHAGHLGEDGPCQCKSIVNDSYCGAICTVHVENSKKIGSRSIADGFNDAPPRDQAIANMHFIALAGTVANRLFDEGFNGIEAVKALPEMFDSFRAVLAIAKRNERGIETDKADALLARLKGDAE